MEKRYFLPITLLLASTKNIHQDFFFQTRLPPQRISQEECVVQLHVSDGAMLSCEIKTATGGTLLRQEQAIAALNTLGMLEWQRVPAPFQAYRGEEKDEQKTLVRQIGSPLALTYERIPVRRVHNAEISDHSHRRVFLLIDGARNVQQIAKLLGRSSAEIVDILHVLSEQKIIIF